MKVFKNTTQLLDEFSYCQQYPNQFFIPTFFANILKFNLTEKIKNYDNFIYMSG